MCGGGGSGCGFAVSVAVLVSLCVGQAKAQADKVSMFKAYYTVLADRRTLNVRAEMTFHVPVGQSQSGAFKSLWHRGDVQPVSVRSATNGDGVALEREEQLYDDGVFKLRLTLPTPVQGPAEHQVIIEFMVEQAVCLSDGQNFLATLWTGWWGIPVTESYLNIKHTPPVDFICASGPDTGEDCGYLSADGNGMVYHQREGAGGITKITWPISGLSGDTGLRECPARQVNSAAASSSHRGALAAMLLASAALLSLPRDL